MQRNHAAHHTAHYVTRWRLLRAHVRRPPAAGCVLDLEAAAALRRGGDLSQGCRCLAGLGRTASDAARLKSAPHFPSATTTMACTASAWGALGGGVTRPAARKPPEVHALVVSVLPTGWLSAAGYATIVNTWCGSQVEHYDYSPLTAMALESLPTFLGGALEEPRGPIHFCPAPISMSTI